MYRPENTELGQHDLATSPAIDIPLWCLSLSLPRLPNNFLNISPVCSILTLTLLQKYIPHYFKHFVRKTLDALLAGFTWVRSRHYWHECFFDIPLLSPENKITCAEWGRFLLPSVGIELHRAGGNTCYYSVLHGADDGPRHTRLRDWRDTVCRARWRCGIGGRFVHFSARVVLAPIERQRRRR